MAEDDKLDFNGMNYTQLEKREEERLEHKMSAKVQNQVCIVLNISKKGVLLQTAVPVFWFPIDESIWFELEIEGQWIPINGIIKWVASDHEHSRVGVFIKRAPELYMNFLKEVYTP